jgi:exodeoxyribonuclease VII small subunit
MAKDTKDANGDVAALPFEKALTELESIVQKLEGGNVPLEDSIKIYERGEALKKRCEALLKDAEARVEKITLDAKGKPSGSTPLARNCRAGSLRL